MSQPRTALIAGVVPEGPLLEFLHSEEGWRFCERGHPTLRWTEDGKCLGFPFAVAYDPPEGCVELEMPLRINSLLTPYNSKVYPAWKAALKKWERLAGKLRGKGLDVPDGTILLAEIERP